MQQFTVPQFIDVEGKIIGPITVRQFIVLLAGGLFAFIAFKVADFALFVVIGILDLAITGTLAFFKVNGVPFHFFLLNIVQTMRRPSLRVWDKTVTLADVRADLKKKPEEHAAEAMIIPRKRLEHAPLSQLSLVVDTGGVYKGEGMTS